MDAFLRAAAAIMLAVILSLTLSKQWKEAGVLLCIALCCMAATVAMDYLEPVVTLMSRLQNENGLNSDLLEILLKVAGIGLVAQLAELICADSGNASLGKALQILASAVILWISLPLFTSLMTLVSDILGGL